MRKTNAKSKKAAFSGLLLSRQPRFNRPTAIVLVGIMAVVGIYIIYRAFASGTNVALEAESAAATSPASIGSDSAASGGRFLQFDSASVAACSGVSVQPGENIQAKIDAYPGGTTFCFAPGIHRMTDVVFPKSGSILVGSSGTILNGSRQVSSFGRSGNWWTVTGQTQNFVPFTSSADPNFSCHDSTYKACHLLEGVFRDDTSLFQVASLGELGPGKFYFDNAADTVYLGDDPTGRKIEITVSSGAFKGYGGATGQSNVTVRGFIIEKFAGTSESGRWMQAALQLGDGAIVENNEIRLNSVAGASISERGYLRGNNIHHNGQYGFIGGHLDTSLIENNEIAFNNTAGFGENWDAGGSKIIRSKNITIRGNHVHDNKGPGLWADWENYNIIYENNYVENNTNIGIFHEANALGIIRNNILKDNGSLLIGKSIYYGADIFLNSSKDTEIYGNTIETNGNGIGLYDSARGETIYGLLEVRNVYVHDNTITQKRTGQQSGLVGRSTAFSANNRFQNNRYYMPDLTGAHWVWQDAKTQSQWQAIGHDTTGTFATGTGSASCAQTTSNYGSTTITANVSVSGTYKVWSRAMTSDANNNSYHLAVDNNCPINVGDTSIPSNAWSWVDYQDGSTATKTTLNLTAGTHTIKLIGREPGVKLDKVMLIADGCIPTTTGDNCTGIVADTTPPSTPTNLSASATSPTQINLSWSAASDNVGITGYDVYRSTTGSAPVKVSTVATTSYADTALTAGATYSYYLRARDAAGNLSSASATVSATTLSSTTTGDTIAPLVNISTPASGSTVSGNISVAAIGNDNVGVTKLEIYIDGSLRETSYTNAVSIRWNTRKAAVGSHNITAKVYDAAGNIGQASVTVYRN